MITVIIRTVDTFFLSSRGYKNPPQPSFRPLLSVLIFIVPFPEVELTRKPDRTNRAHFYQGKTKIPSNISLSIRGRKMSASLTITFLIYSNFSYSLGT